MRPETIGFVQAADNLPMSLRQIVQRLPEGLTTRVQEIRLRLGAPLMLSVPDGEWLVTTDGRAVHSSQGELVVCSREVLEECFLMLCGYSVHTHQQELRSGFVTARNGCRAGVAGTAVVENNTVVSVREVTSICLRVARRHDGCAGALAAALIDSGGLHSALLCGEPASGKSSLLKDLARQLSTGERGRYYRTAVVDERGELSADGSLAFCDVLRSCPKDIGIQQAVRCFAPEVVIFDELGSMGEVGAVLEGLNSGVAAITTAHCRDERTLLQRPQLAAAIRSGAFERIVYLQGRRSPGAIARIIEAGDLVEADRTIYDRTGGVRCGAVCVGLPEAARRFV